MGYRINNGGEQRYLGWVVNIKLPRWHRIGCSSQPSGVNQNSGVVEQKDAALVT